MEYQEAMRLLGVEREADASTVRRAYLRLLKQHPPERDPDGFQRVREAYEVARRFARASSPETGSEPYLQGTVGTSGAGRPPAEREREVESHEPARDVLPLTNPLRDSLESYRERMAQAESEHEAIELGREAAQRLDTPEAYELWFSVVDEGVFDESRDSQLLGIVRERLARGHSGLSRLLRENLPHALSDEELLEWQAAPGANADFTSIAAEFLRRGYFADATSILVAGYQRLAADPLEPRSSPWLFARSVQHLLADDHPVEAQRVFDAFRRGHADSDRGDPTRFAVLAELMSVRSDLHPELRSAIARAFLADAPQSADQDIEDWSRLNPSAAKQQLATLKARAPILHGFYAAAFKPPKLFTPRFSFRPGWGFGVFFGLNMIRMLWTDDIKKHEPDPRPLQRVERSYVAPPQERPAPDPDRFADPAWKRLVENHAQGREQFNELCSLGEPKLCEASRAWGISAGPSRQKADHFDHIGDRRKRRLSRAGLA